MSDRQSFLLGALAALGVAGVGYHTLSLLRSSETSSRTPDGKEVRRGPQKPVTFIHVCLGVVLPRVWQERLDRTNDDRDAQAAGQASE